MSDKSPSKERTFGEPWNDPNPRMSGKNGAVRQMSVGPTYPLNPCLAKLPSGTRNLPNED